MYSLRTPRPPRRPHLPHLRHPTPSPSSSAPPRRARFGGTERWRRASTCGGDDGRGGATHGEERRADEEADQAGEKGGSSSSATGLLRAGGSFDVRWRGAGLSRLSSLAISWLRYARALPGDLPARPINLHIVLLNVLKRLHLTEQVLDNERLAHHLESIENVSRLHLDLLPRLALLVLLVAFLLLFLLERRLLLLDLLGLQALQYLLSRMVLEYGVEDCLSNLGRPGDGVPVLDVEQELTKVDGGEGLYDGVDMRGAGEGGGGLGGGGADFLEELEEALGLVEGEGEEDGVAVVLDREEVLKILLPVARGGSAWMKRKRSERKGRA
jgi:hypothetical protein